MVDFHIDIINPTNPLTSDFNYTLDCVSFSQFVKLPTQNKDHNSGLIYFSLV